MASSTFLHFNSLGFWLLLLPTVFSITIPNCPIKLNSSLSTDGKSSWNSLSGEFAFGFRNVPFGDEGFAPLLAIWFTKVPNNTIVWYAKDVGAPAGSTVQLRNNGLVVYDPQGNQKWRRPKNNATFCAIMQDNGNLVLLDENGSRVWESFEEPSDTILPGQTLKWPQTLRARQSDISFSNGSFELRLQQDGNLVLYYSPEGNEINKEEKIAPYWASGALTSGSELIFNEFGQIYIRNESTVIYNVTKGISGSREFYYLARMDSDGVFRLYNLRRSDNGSAGGCVQGWNILENVPDDICLTFTRQVGNVVCGFNSYCVNINGKSECWCPDQYSPFSYNNQTSCRPDFPLPFCQVDGWEMKKEQVKIIEYNNLDWPWSDYDLLIGTSIDKDVCRQKCLEDCFCVVAIYDGLDKGYCWKKKYPLSNGRKSKRVTRTAFVKVPAVDLKKKQHKNQSTLVLIISVLLGSSVFFNILLFISFFVAFSYLYHKKLLNLQKVSSLSSATVRWYTYKELEEATGGYKQVLGKEDALIDWAYDCYIKKKLAHLVDNDEEAKNDKKRLEKLVMVAIWCIQDDPSLRPSMKKVTQMLEDVVKVSVPPRPSVFNLSS
ncbi:hypothetical protein L6164_022973 [Bauhinia variegata]|uniref:Uncharacterized protein n=2 Tax=Bauhinia variegata TaxID=167791 RepID=A0ACB9MIP7_BAUVA|nr:hypothetical protein L6164_022973 [Bauhinia variegata]